MRHFGSKQRPTCLQDGMHLLVAKLLAILGLVLSPPSYCAEPTFRDEMDGSRPALQLIDSSEFTILAQHIDRKARHLEAGWEVVEIQGPAGESAQLAFGLPSAPVIAELALAAKVRCNRPGTQIAARVVLPRSTNSKTGMPHEILVRGGNIGRGLPNERLVLEDLPKLLQRQARVLRLQTADPIDERGAFVSQLVFLVPGGNGVTELAVDCIELYGILQTRVDPNLQLTAAEAEALFDGPQLPGIPNEAPPPAAHQQNVLSEQSPVHRIIQWQGEGFEFLKKIGFSAVWMSRQPTADELAAAARANIYLVCPPPGVEELTRDGITAQWDPVLAWDLGQMLAREDLQQLVRLRQIIQQCDSKESRVTVMTCGQISRDASRATDGLMLGRELLGTDLTLRDYVAWLGQRQRIARPGTPIWATIESELAPPRMQQITTLGGSTNEIALSASYEQLTAITAAAMSIRCRDYVFTSNSSLETKDAATEQRARNLELLNLRLRMLTPWLATGKVTGVDRCSAPGLSAMVFQAERSHLLVPINWSRDFRSQQSFHVPGRVSFIVPGVAETTDVYLLTLAGAKRLRHERTTGGLKIEVDSLPLDGMIMLSSDAQAFTQVSQYLRHIAARAARLHRDSAAHRYQELEQVAVEGADRTDRKKELSIVLGRAKQGLGACDRDLTNGYADLAYQRIDEVQRILSQAEYLLRAGDGTPANIETPLVFHVETLQREKDLISSLAGTQPGASALAGGDFENLTSLLQQGWRHQQLPLSGITSSVRLSSHEPYQGTYCLELEATDSDPSSPTSVVPTAPVWISSPPIAVDAGELVEITGMARVPQELIGTVDGLQIIDSLGGPGMATRVLVSPSWTSFKILRGTNSDTQVIVSIALSGLGRAQVDHLQVRTLKPDKSLANQNPTVERR